MREFLPSRGSVAFLVFLYEKLIGKRFCLRFLLRQCSFPCFSDTFFSRELENSLSPVKRKETEKTGCQFRYRTFGFLLSKIEFFFAFALEKKRSFLFIEEIKLNIFDFKWLLSESVQIRSSLWIYQTSNNFRYHLTYVLVQSQEIYQMFSLTRRL